VRSRILNSSAGCFTTSLLRPLLVRKSRLCSGLNPFIAVDWPITRKVSAIHPLPTDCPSSKLTHLAAPTRSGARTTGSQGPSPPAKPTYYQPNPPQLWGCFPSSVCHHRLCSRISPRSNALMGQRMDRALPPRRDRCSVQLLSFCFCPL
jgi:hypothetical protein